MAQQEEIRNPTIQICLSPAFHNDEVLLNVTCGVEEESIPYEVFRGSGDDAVALAYEGARKSVLEVGIGLDNQGRVAVHYRKLPKDSPLFVIDYHTGLALVRSTCSNAARLVKGTPFIL